jgi:arylsulfatase A-like enzyme
VTITSRRSFLRTIGLGSAALALQTRLSGQPLKASRKPNLLVFLPDQLRADTVVGDAASAVHAPNIHALASESVVFERAYVTHPICAPARSSLLSGRWPHQTGCTRNETFLPREVLCLPEMIHDSDYRTGYFGKWHLGDEALAQHGFEEWISTEEYVKTAGPGKKLRIRSDYTKFLLSKGHQPQPKKGQTFARTYVSTLPFEISKPRFLEVKACDFLERHRNEPFILFIASYEPHPPYNGPFNDEHPLETIALDATAGDKLGEEIPLRYRLLQEHYRNELVTEAGYRQTKQKYLGLITEIDYAIGSILAKLDELGLRQNTVTVLTSDHGDMMSGHGLLDKMVMYDQAARVPLLVRAPDEKPHSISQPFSQIDFAPTMLELLGKPQHPQCVGQSKAGLVRGETAGPEPIFLQWAPSRGAVHGYKKPATQQEIDARDESTRAIVNPGGWKLCLRDKDKNELYNMRDDPQERQNLYYDHGHREVIADLTNQIHRWQESTGDSLLV